MSLRKLSGGLACTNVVLALVILPAALQAGEERTCHTLNDPGEECFCNGEFCYTIGWEGDDPVCTFKEEWECCGTPQQNAEAMEAACDLVEGYCDLWVQGGSYCPSEN